MNTNDYLAYLAYNEELRKQGKEPELYGKPDFNLPGAVDIKIKSPFLKPISKYTFSTDIYDEIKHSLNVFNSYIEIPPDSNQHRLCKVLFLKYDNILKDLETKEKKLARQGKKTWSWDEIFEFQGEELDNIDNIKGWREVYNAARAINKLVKDKSSNTGFISVTTKTVTLNTDYQN
ncbi:MAG: hypothetical protein HYV90_03795 [Candidatus Woesebacteria bacterium]|nr:MAG: hypothetical protein HYV90_03795 [Candidatus Woesebacteria bacterium]